MLCCCFFFFKQKTAYEMRISDWSSDVCSSDLKAPSISSSPNRARELSPAPASTRSTTPAAARQSRGCCRWPKSPRKRARRRRSDAHTSELQSLMRISSSVFCLKPIIFLIHFNQKKQIYIVDSFLFYKVRHPP